MLLNINAEGAEGEWMNEMLKMWVFSESGRSGESGGVWVFAHGAVVLEISVNQ